MLTDYVPLRLCGSVLVTVLVACWPRAANTWAWICWISVFATRLMWFLSLNPIPSVLNSSSCAPFTEIWDNAPTVCELVTAWFVISFNGCEDACKAAVALDGRPLLLLVVDTTDPVTCEFWLEFVVEFCTCVCGFESSTFTAFSVYSHLLSLSWSLRVA